MSVGALTVSSSGATVGTGGGVAGGGMAGIGAGGVLGNADMISEMAGGVAAVTGGAVVVMLGEGLDGVVVDVDGEGLDGVVVDVDGEGVAVTAV
jgi:hypothetical protein